MDEWVGGVVAGSKFDEILIPLLIIVCKNNREPELPNLGYSGTRYTGERIAGSRWKHPSSLGPQLQIEPNAVFWLSQL